jgi:hypothetical protein
VRFQIFTAACKNTAVFRDGTPCSLEEIDASEVLTASIIRVTHRPDVGNSKHL